MIIWRPQLASRHTRAHASSCACRRHLPARARCPMHTIQPHDLCLHMHFVSPAVRVWHEVRLHAEARLNMLRCWGGSACQPPALLDACDAFGVLVWVEFWVTGDNNGRGGGSADYPLDHKLFLRCAKDLVTVSRTHPSVAIYVGGNEQMCCPPSVRCCRPVRACVCVCVRACVCAYVWMCGCVCE